MIHSDNIIVPNHQPTTTSHVDTLRSLRVPETIRDSFSPSNLTDPMPSIGMTIRIMDIAPFNNNILRSWYFSYCSQINACIIADDNSFFINKTRVIPFILNGRIINRILQMYLIDRNGNAAGRFPVAFKGKCEQGISVYDYDNNRNYRIFVPCENREVYLYGLDGKPVEGWNPQKTDKPVVSKVQHFRVADKDYIVFADRYRFYILDRKGKERVRVSSVFDLKPHTDVYLTRKGGQPVLVFADKGGQVHVVNFSGQTETSRVEGLSDRFEMNIVDWDGNGTGDVLFTDGNRVLVTRLDGTPLFEKKMEAKTLGFPYVYRFSAKDVRVGLTDPEQNHLFLLSADGKLSKGFPITGDSPFSIVFLGNDGFFLFAGTGNNTILKYKVQR